MIGRDEIMKDNALCRRVNALRVVAVSAVLGIGVSMLVPELAYAQSIRLQAQTSEIYAGMPFQLSVVATDFDESPEPEVEPFAIEDAEVQLLGVSPQISSMTTIINGRRTSKKDVTFIYRYQITPKREGVYSIPVITAHQGAKRADSEQRVTFTAQTVQTTPDMKISLELPNRKLWVGETFEAQIGWYLRKDVSSQVFSLPILQMPEVLDVEEPMTATQAGAIPLNVGSRQIAFPYTRDTVTYQGLEYTRFLISVKLTPLKSGMITLEPSKVLAELEAGMARDTWGFGRTTYKLYRAEDKARTIEVKALPENGRPATFSNAMGADYAISVRADRTIVKAGDPIMLTIDISSPSSLEGLILPSLVDAGLKEQLFGVSNDAPIGENIEGAQKTHIKRFTVPVRVKSERVTEIPPLAFSYFNPVSEEYTTVRSQPIALSVTAVEKVSAADVVGAKIAEPRQAQANGNEAKLAQPEPDIAAGAVELGLVAPSETIALQTTIKSNFIAILSAIYAFPFVVLGGLVGVRRLRRKSAENSEQREAARQLAKAIDEAATDNARVAASKISNALNQFLRSTESPREAFTPICEQIDAEAYRPDAGDRPLAKETVDSLRAAIPTHVNPKYAKWIVGMFALLLCAFVGLGGVPEAVAQAPAVAGSEERAQGVTYEVAAAAYHKALATTDRAARIASFKRAQAYFMQLSEQNPEDYAYYVDAGNAALGAVDMGHAVLNYKRALLRNPTNEQARYNLSYIESIQGEKVRHSGRAISSALFFDSVMTPEQRLLLAALFFAIGVLLMIPWHAKYRKVLSFIGIVPLIVWLWLMAGYWTSPQAHEGVIMSEVWLKTADNAGASNVSAMALEPGYSVEIVKERDGWVQVRYGDGSQGWVSRTAVEYVDNTK